MLALNRYIAIAAQNSITGKDSVTGEKQLQKSMRDRPWASPRIFERGGDEPGAGNICLHVLTFGQLNKGSAKLMSYLTRMQSHENSKKVHFSPKIKYLQHYSRPEVWAPSPVLPPPPCMATFLGPIFPHLCYAKIFVKKLANTKPGKQMPSSSRKISFFGMGMMLKLHLTPQKPRSHER